MFTVQSAIKSLAQKQTKGFSLLKQRIEEIVPIKRAEAVKFKEQYQDRVLGTYTVKQAIFGMRGMKALFQDISTVDPYKGLEIRGYSIPQLAEKLPTAIPGGEPLPEAMLWLCLTGTIPNAKEVKDLSEELKVRGRLDQDVIDHIISIPTKTHGMTMLSQALLYLQKDSIFADVYAEGKTHKNDFWRIYLEDSLNLIAKIPQLAAVIYRHKYHNSEIIQADESLDWAANYGHMMGYNSEELYECLRGYLSIHCDHEGGPVSAHATHLVGSALADPYLAYCAGNNGLAGPLHGLANQEVLSWMLELDEEVQRTGKAVTDDYIREYVRDIIASGRVVPGYGHAVLRSTDPRFVHQYEFCQKYDDIKNNRLVNLLHRCSNIIPETLKEYEKIQNPYPNVDAHSGVLLYGLGLKEYHYYTVIFSVSRSIGCCSYLIWDRIFGAPIERPGSLTIDAFKKKLDQEGR